VLSFIPNHTVRPRTITTTEHASWMVVVAAATLAARQVDPVERVRYAEAARHMRFAARRWWPDPQALRDASPTFLTNDGESHNLVEAVLRSHGDPDSGVRAAEMCFLAFEWRPAA
jgi:hypothetical protein